MDNHSSDYCGYVWPEDHDVDDDPVHQSCCYRETMGNEDHCAWHVDPETRQKRAATVEVLVDARTPPEIREQNSPVAELLDGANLSGLDLGNTLSFERTSLRDANFSSTHLSGAKFGDRTEESGSDLSGANLRGVDLTNAYLRYADFSNADLRDATLCDAYLRRADLSGAALARIDLTGANLSKVDLSGAHPADADLTEVNLSDAIVSEATVSDTTLSHANLQQTNFTNASLQNANLQNADLSDANLSNANAQWANLEGTNLTGTNFANADIRGTDLSDATVSRATQCGRIVQVEQNSSTAKEWDRLARTYGELKLLFDDHGMLGKSRHFHVLQRRARGLEAKETGGWTGYSAYLRSVVSKVLTGYGASISRILGAMAALFVLSTAIYWLGGVENSLYYSVVTFTTSPPEAKPPLGLAVQITAMIETFLGTLLIVLLGYILGNRERF